MVVDPDNRDESPVLPEFIGKFFKGVSTNPSIHEPCLYTVSSFTMYYQLVTLTCH